MHRKQKPPPTPSTPPQPQRPQLQLIIPPQLLGNILLYQTPPPHQTPPPLYIFQQKNIPVLEFYAPPLYFNPEMNFNNVSFLRRRSNGLLERIPSLVIRHLAENPSLAPDNLDLKWATPNGELIPAHLPLQSDLIYLPEVARIFLDWSIRMTCQELNGPIFPPQLSLLIDPTPMIPRTLGTFLLKSAPLKITATSLTNAMRAVKTTLCLNQLQISVKWVEAQNLRKRRYTILNFAPQISSIFDPLMQKEVGCSSAPSLRPGKGNCYPLNLDMCIFYWNARGIARPTFKRNLLYFISVYHPNMVVLSETRTSLNNTLQIIQSLPFDKHILVEPEGFAGGILILWNSDSIEFEVIGMNRQSIHGFCQCELFQGSGVAELISAMAAGWNAKLIVETWSLGNLILTSIGLAIAASHTGGRHVCIVSDHHSRATYISAMSALSSTIKMPEIIVGDPEEVMSMLEGIDFLVVDSDRKDFSRFLRLARLSHQGAVLLCKNAGGGKTASCGYKWRRVLDGGRRVVRTTYLPVGDGLDMAHVASPGSPSSSSGSNNHKRRWIKHFDQNSGEEYVIRTM